ncbi:hypothetical protein KSW81_003252 [Nannochloris sp. 'desiccata']|nr:hypothetical protein KSW81_003252 [Chlorella desiccata (nom. nud.)]
MRSLRDLTQHLTTRADDSHAAPVSDPAELKETVSGNRDRDVKGCVLMGVALFAALDGREMLATPPELLNVASLDAAGNADAAKANRLVAPVTLGNTSDKRRMEVSTMTRSGDRDVVRMVPFVQVKMALAAGHTTNRSYPPFDPLEVFAEDGAAQASASMATGVIYGAKVESEVSLRTVDFPIQTAAFDESSALSADEVEGVVRNTSAILTDGDVQVAALHYVDPQRFGETPVTRTLGASFGIRIVPENVSVATRDTEGGTADSYAEDMILFPAERNLAEALEEAGYTGPDAEGMASAFATLLKSEDVGEGHLLRLGIETREDLSRIVRASLYDGRRHILTIALNDKRQYVKGSEPEPNPAVLAAFDLEPAVIRPRGDLPSVYDGIYRAAFSYGMSRPMTRQLIQLLASDVDFQAKLNPADEIEVFFSQPDTEDQATEDSQLLYVQATFGGHTRTFYRFQMEDGVVDYFDEEGRSARQFLLRNPVPNGRFTSGFGGRRHPILGYTRMHTGVDWAAPRGTPIIASGNGLVEQGRLDRRLRAADRDFVTPTRQPSALRIDGQRHQGRPDACAPARRARPQGRGAGSVPAGARTYRRPAKRAGNAGAEDGERRQQRRLTATPFWALPRNLFMNIVGRRRVARSRRRRPGDQCRRKAEGRRNPCDRRECRIACGDPQRLGIARQVARLTEARHVRRSAEHRCIPSRNDDAQYRDGHQACDPRDRIVDAGSSARIEDRQSEKARCDERNRTGSACSGGQSISETAERHGRQRGAANVELALFGRRIVWDLCDQQKDGQPAQRQVHREDRTPDRIVERRKHHPADHRSKRGRQCRGGSPDADCTATFRLRIGLGDNGEATRHHQRRSDALQGSRADQKRRVGREGAQQRRRDEEADAGDECATHAEPVTGGAPRRESGQIASTHKRWKSTAHRQARRQDRRG